MGPTRIRPTERARPGVLHRAGMVQARHGAARAVPRSGARRPMDSRHRFLSGHLHVGCLSEEGDGAELTAVAGRCHDAVLAAPSRARQAGHASACPSDDSGATTLSVEGLVGRFLRSPQVGALYPWARAVPTAGPRRMGAR
jgi:hypothetical protein